MTKFDQNLSVIGGGSAGLVSALIAAKTGAKTTLIEKDLMGGDCLNTGCVPSKTLIRSAKIASLMKHAAKFGLTPHDDPINLNAIMQRVQKVIKEIAPHDSVERFETLGVTCLHGHAQLLPTGHIKVNDTKYLPRKIIIATGANPNVPPIPGLDKVNYLTSDSVWKLNALPKRLAILGAGNIGCELAQAFAKLGAQITLIESADRILLAEDQDVADLITKTLANENVKILTKHKATEIKPNALLCQYDQQSITIPFDEILIATGRTPNTKGLGLQQIGLICNPNNTIQVNKYMQSNLPHIFACGDVTGPYQFTHTASHQAWYATANALFGEIKRSKIDYSVIPHAIFTDPEIARVGLNEQEAKAQNIPYTLSQYSLKELDRAIIEGANEGFIKVLTIPKKDRILGATIVSQHAGELIGEYICAMKNKIGLNKILGTIHIYPTWSEANKFVAGVWKTKQFSPLILKLMKQYQRWKLN